MNIGQIRFSICCAVVLSLLSLPVAWAASPSDDIKGTTDAILAVLADDSLQKDAKRTKMEALVDERFDFELMSRRVIPTVWAAANAEERAEFVSAFKQILGNTYLEAVDAYTEERIDFVNEEIKESKKSKVKYAQVETLIVSGNRTIPMNYRAYLKNGEWLVYDVIPEGVSTVRNYQTLYEPIAKKGGMPALLEHMRATLNQNSAG